MTKCEIDNDVNCHGGSAEFVGSGKEYKELKEKQVLGLFSGGKDVSVALLTG